MSETERNAVLAGSLYIVATPIGNMDDITYRAVKVLSGVDFIAAEDTRVTAKLLQRLELSKPMVSYYEHNLRERGERILARIQAGESCALVSDAGTPAVSDPGEDLVRICAEAGVPVYTIPGACAAVSALTLAGFSTGRFTFEGFLSVNRSERMEHLHALASERRTMVFYEAPHKLRRTLDDFAETFGAERKITLCRELTKLHEEAIRTTVGEAVKRYRAAAPRGEFVLVVEGVRDKTGGEYWRELSCADHVAILEQGGLSRMDAIKAAAKERGVGKSQVYAEVGVKNR